jgi:hypothetical protein
MLKVVCVAAFVVFPITIIAVWIFGIVACFLFVRKNRRHTHDFQCRNKTWRWKLKLAAIWPLWFLGIVVFELRRFCARIRKQKKASD